eukprot:gene14456-20468_t
MKSRGSVSCSRISPIFKIRYAVPQQRRSLLPPPQACPFKSLLNDSTPLRQLPFQPESPGTPYKLRLGLKNPSDPWLDVDEDDEAFVAEMKQRRKHIQERRHAVIQLVDEEIAHASARELLQSMVHDLPKLYPKRYHVSGTVITNVLTGDSFDVSWPTLDPLEAAGLLVQEDLCLLSPNASGDAYRLLGGVVCFPAHWSMLENLNKDIPDIHDPVPRWRTDAATSAHKFFTHLTTDKPKIRWNWSLSATTELHISKFYSRPLQEEADEMDPAGVDKLQLRLERQHFIRLPKSQAIIFTIRTYMQVVSEALRMPQLLELLDSEANGVTVH